jgi:hypothetical protein
MGRYRLGRSVTVRFGQPRQYPPELTREARQAETASLLEEIRALGATPTAIGKRSASSGPVP